MKMSAENEKEDVVKFSAQSKWELLANDVSRKKDFCYEVCGREWLCLLPSQRYISFAAAPSRVALVSLS